MIEAHLWEVLQRLLESAAVCFVCGWLQVRGVGRFYERPCRTLKKRKSEALDPRPGQGQSSASSCEEARE